MGWFSFLPTLTTFLSPPRPLAPRPCVGSHYDGFFSPHGVYPPGNRPKLSFLFYAGENGPRISDTDALCRDQPPRWAPASSAALKDAIQDERTRPPRNTDGGANLGQYTVPRGAYGATYGATGSTVKGTEFFRRGFPSFFFFIVEGKMFRAGSWITREAFRYSQG